MPAVEALVVHAAIIPTFAAATAELLALLLAELERLADAAALESCRHSLEFFLPHAARFRLHWAELGEATSDPLWVVV